MSRSQSRGASTLVTPVGRPPSTRELTAGYSGATEAPDSSSSSDPLLQIHCSQPRDEISNLTPFDADSRNAPLPIFPMSGFQYSGWDGEPGGPQPNETQDFKWYEPASTTIHDTKATEKSSGTPDTAVCSSIHPTPRFGV